MMILIAIIGIMLFFGFNGPPASYGQQNVTSNGEKPMKDYSFNVMMTNILAASAFFGLASYWAISNPTFAVFVTGGVANALMAICFTIRNLK